VRVAQTLVATLVICLAGVSAVACSANDAEPSPASSSYPASTLQARADYLKQLALDFQLDDPPEVDLIRFVSSEEWPDTQISCMNAAGFAVSLLADGVGIDASSIPESQRHKGGPFHLAMYECEAKYTLDPANSGPLSDAQLSLLYDWYVNESAPCLEAHGITVAAPPTRQTFIETYFTDKGWLPYRSIDVMAMPMPEWNAINAACPQSPEDSVLNFR
jgi:hypothetical protein